MKNEQISFGLSFNPGFRFETEDTAGEKGILHSPNFELEGSSAILGKCFHLFGLNATGVVPFEFKFSIEGHILDGLLDNKLQMPHVRLKVLETSPFAIYPTNKNHRKRKGSKLFGLKSIVTTQEELLQEAEEQIRLLNGQWKFVTGVNESLSRLGFALLGENQGFRSFSPHHTLCSPNNSTLLRLLKNTDELIFNQHEFRLIKMSFQEIHNLGVRVIVVTNNGENGVVSLCNERNNFNREEGIFLVPKVQRGTQIYTQGAGDAFNGAKSSKLILSGLNFSNVSLNEFLEFCNFASRFATKKVLLKGASTLPQLSEVR